MPIHQTRIDYQDAMDAAAREWLRVRMLIVGGRVRHFTVQYETILADARVPVVRYDTAHGYAHRARLNRRGDQVSKEAVAHGLPLEVALSIALDDLTHNWPRYRAAFFEDET